MRRVCERPQQRDGDGVELVVGDHPADRLGRGVDIELDDDLSARVDPLVHLDHGAGHDQRRRQPAAVHREHALDRATGDPAGAAHHGERVTVPGCGDEPDPGAAPLEHGVGADRGPVSEPLGPLQQRGQVDAHGLGQPLQPGQHPGHRVVLRGECLGCAVVAFPVHEHAVGERATDVHADVVHGSTPYTELNETDSSVGFVDRRRFACSARMTIPAEESDVVKAGAQPSPPLAGIGPPDSNGTSGRFSSAGRRPRRRGP